MLEYHKNKERINFYDMSLNIGRFYKGMYRRILINNQLWMWNQLYTTEKVSFLTRTILYRLFSFSFRSLLSTASRMRNASRRYRELVKIKGDNIREEETRLSCQKEMKTELSVTERRLHGSNSFRFNCSTLIRPRFSFHFSDPVPSPAEIFWSRLLRSPAPYVAYELWAKATALKKKEMERNVTLEKK